MKSRPVGVFIVVLVSLSFIALLAVPMANTPINEEPPVESKATFSTFIETNSGPDCVLLDAEIREYSDHDFVMDVFSYVRYRDSTFVSYNKYYVLRVYFDQDLHDGDIIRIYAKYNTVPSIKMVLIENTNWEVVGGGDVYSHWNYYDLVISGLSTPRSSFDIALLPTTPSSNNIRINQVKCVCAPHPPEMKWRDPSTGTVIDDYAFTIDYMITATSDIDPSNVYIDLSVRQTIRDIITDTEIMSTIIDQSLIHVPSLGVPHSFTTHVVPIIDRASAGTDKILISIDAHASVRGKIIGSSDWAGIDQTFNDLRSIEAWWY